MGEGVGAALLKQPDLVAEMVAAAKGEAGVAVTVKIRIDRDLA
jgi:tRNA-dihydrouridine synthase